MFDLEDKFDHVIFDEASQIPLENALPALARGERITVVGDKNQMPPNRLFHKAISREESDNIAEDEKSSLLDAADDVWPDKMLKYHYRSRYPELIDFSNRAFYDGKLMIAPSCTRKQSEYRALDWHQINGKWEKRTNEIEGEAVINYLLEQLPAKEQMTGKTLWGVVTFNQDQADILVDILQKKLEGKRKESELTDVEKIVWEWCIGSITTNSYVWIKNLENVQGDEVKHMIMSVGYAIDSEMGRVPNRFGLLNREGGGKRLNVAVTRAQESIDIFCSFDPDYDLEVASTSNRGPKLFKDYLRYVKYISEGNDGDAQNLLEDLQKRNNLSQGEVSFYDYDSPFEKKVAQALRKRGYEIHTQVGSYGYRIDLGLVNPNNEEEYLLGIECDGAQYHSSKSARERDIHRQKFLENKGWQIERIWSRKWWEKPQQVLDELEEKINKALNTEELDKEKEVDDTFESKKDRVESLMDDIDYNETFEKITQRIIELMLETRDKYSNKELQKNLNYKDAEGIRKAIQPLRDQNIILKEGEGPGTKYYIDKLRVLDYHKKAQ
ncbi:AAA domain-containing protein [Halarsenatibacter silvermanii]|uniref:AAA domain-containing protein n=1 Tax=Halarsenatibacter silvermanii TaxID=321763 RepID=A0A1G9U4Z3_9FIRM|nr:AAA domain-containing protein [Halarsenatibacter silvermanii]SDM55079.1 Protein of unknown function [Halarsenatibacter silvermanii]